MGTFFDTLLARLGAGELAETLRGLVGDEPFRDKPTPEKVLTVALGAAVLSFAVPALLVPLLLPPAVGWLLYLLGLAAAAAAALARLLRLPADEAAKAATALSFFLLLGWGLGARPQPALLAIAGSVAASLLIVWIGTRFGRRRA